MLGNDFDFSKANILIEIHSVFGNNKLERIALSDSSDLDDFNESLTDLVDGRDYTVVDFENMPSGSFDWINLYYEIEDDPDARRNINQICIYLAHKYGDDFKFTESTACEFDEIISKFVGIFVHRDDWVSFCEDKFQEDKGLSDEIYNSISNYIDFEYYANEIESDYYNYNNYYYHAY